MNDFMLILSDSFMHDHFCLKQINNYSLSSTPPISFVYLKYIKQFNKYHCYLFLLSNRTVSQLQLDQNLWVLIEKKDRVRIKLLFSCIVLRCNVFGMKLWNIHIKDNVIRGLTE